MDENKTIPGLRLFLLTLLKLIKSGEKVTCDFIEENLTKGIATTLYQCQKYLTAFKQNGFSYDHISFVDQYYQQWAGCGEGNENRKYDCSPEDGFYLLISLALNDLY